MMSVDERKREGVEAERRGPDRAEPGTRDARTGGTSPSGAYVGPADAPKVLVVDDEPSIRELVAAVLRPRYALALVADGEAALETLAREPPDVLVVDKNLPGISGMELLRRSKETHPQTEVVIITGYASVDSAVEALRLGAFDYLLKPFSHVDILVEKVGRAVERKRLLAEAAQMQANLAVSERMASIGLLAAGVSHEINNPLAYVIANLSFLREELEQLTAAATRPCASCGQPAALAMVPILEECDSVQKDCADGAERIKVIVRDLRLFARPVSDEVGPVELRPILESTLNMAWNHIRHRARLVKDYQATPAVTASATKLAQVFLNLVVNAAQAMSDGRATENEIRIVTRTDQDGRAIVELSDTGSGIAPENLDKLFTPFFTTKPPGQGTGLGLAICHRIVSELGGQITVDSRVGVGTTFRVALPAAAATAPAAGHAAAPAEALATDGSMRILVVDDEQRIGQALLRVLGRGNSVTLATSGTEALAILRSGRPFDVVLCDLLMPDLTGMELHREIARCDPGLAARFIFMTGSAFTLEARAFLSSVTNAHVRKPFNNDELSALVRAVANQRTR